MTSFWFAPGAYPSPLHRDGPADRLLGRAVRGTLWSLGREARSQVRTFGVQSMAHRVPGLGPEEWSPEVRSALAPTVGPVAALEARNGPAAESAGQRPLNILTVIAHQPRLLGPFLAWASALVLEGALSRREHELLALRAAANCRSDFEWGHHAVYARAAGLSDGELERVAAGPDAEGWDPHEASLLRAADELQRDWTISDATWERLAERYDQARLVEIPFVVGQYTMLSMLANTTGVEVEPGYDALPAPPRE